MFFVGWLLPDYLQNTYKKIITIRMEKQAAITNITSEPKQLRIITYMCPSHPIELYEGLVEYLEETTGSQVTLQHEWRSVEGRDVFKNNTIDLAFMTATQYLMLMEENHPQIELLPVTPVFKHDKNNTERPGYYADIIVHADKMRKHFADKFLDLRGCRWAYSDAESFSSSKVLLNKLHDLGENASFFGNILRSGSHLASLKMVLSKQAEAACIDSTTLQAYKSILPDNAKDVIVLESMGPLAPYPIVVNSRMSENMKKMLIQTFLHFRYRDPKFIKYGLLKFVQNHPDAYNEMKQIRKAVENKSFTVPYY